MGNESSNSSRQSVEPVAKPTTTVLPLDSFTAPKPVSQSTTKSNQPLDSFSSPQPASLNNTFTRNVQKKD